MCDVHCAHRNIRHSHRTYIFIHFTYKHMLIFNYINYGTQNRLRIAQYATRIQIQREREHACSCNNNAACLWLPQTGAHTNNWRCVKRVNLFSAWELCTGNGILTHTDIGCILTTVLRLRKLPFEFQFFFEKFIEFLSLFVRLVDFGTAPWHASFAPNDFQWDGHLMAACVVIFKYV